MVREFIDKKIKELEDRLFERLSKEVEEYLTSKLEAEIKEMFSHLESDIQKTVQAVLANPTQVIQDNASIQSFLPKLKF